MRAACLQLNSGADVALNLARVAALLERAAAARAELVVLPENFSFMGEGSQAKVQVAREASLREVLPFLAEQAKRHRLLLVAGSLLLPGDGEKLRNSCPVFAADGRCLATYDKIHLFDIELEDDIYRESAFIQAGNEPVRVDFGDWRLGLSICYDLRFPELYRLYAAEGCNLLTVPSAFTVPTGRAHWETLLRARAIENQAYVLAPAQIGAHPGGRQTYGHSLIIDPWGAVLARAENHGREDGELVLAELDLQRVHEVRSQIPALQNRRLH